MRKLTKVYFKVAQILALIIGIIYCITLVGAIFGVPLIIAGNKFGKYYSMTDEELVYNRGSIMGWGIFLAIMLAPTIILLIVVLVLVFMVNSHIKSIEEGNVEKSNRTFGQAVSDGASSVWNGTKKTFNIKSKLEKQKDQLDKLTEMKEAGIITEEEYQAKRKQILDI